DQYAPPRFQLDPKGPEALAAILDLGELVLPDTSLVRLAGLSLPLADGRLQRVVLGQEQQEALLALQGAVIPANEWGELNLGGAEGVLTPADVERLVCSPYLARVAHITGLEGSERGDVLLQALARSSHATGIESIRAAEGGVTDNGLRALAGA